MQTRRIIVGSTIVAAIVALFAGRAAAGPKWEFGEDGWFQFSMLGQPQFSHLDDAMVADDFYLRRGRLIFSGQVTDGVKVFIETDNANAGRSGSGSVKTEIQDAFVDFRLGASEHWIEAGLILLPFSLESKSSAITLLGVDYNSEAIKLANTFVWRDYGAELHGHFAKKLAYRMGMFDGYDSGTNTKNPDAALRFTGHLAYSVIGEVETSWFYTQNSIGTRRHLTIGAGYDTQDNASMETVMTPTGPTPETTVARDSKAWVVDMQSSIDLTDHAALLLNGAYYDWDNSGFVGDTAFVETGLLLNKKWMPTAKVALSEPDAQASTTDYTVGLDYFVKGHSARAGVEYRWGDSSEWILLGLQFVL